MKNGENEMKRMKDYIDDGKRAIGKKELIKFYAGDVLTEKEAIHAYCYECQGFFIDAPIATCGQPDCPLYQNMPYKERIK